MICNILFCVHGRACHVDGTRCSGCVTRVVRVTCVRGRILSVRQSSVVSSSARAIKVACNRQPHPPPSTVFPLPSHTAADVGTRCRWHLNTRGDYTRAHGPLSSLNSNQMHKSSAVSCIPSSPLQPPLSPLRQPYTRAIHVHTRAHARNTWYV